MKLPISILLLLTAGTAFADCPSSMDQNTRAECMKIEKSGANYQEWKKQQHQADKNQMKDEKGMVSEVTGKDIRQLQPAAGKNPEKNDRTGQTGYSG